MREKKVKKLMPEEVDLIMKFLLSDDLWFYEKYIMGLSVEEQAKFFEDNPEFMSEYGTKCGRIYLLKDSCYRNILRKLRVREET